MKVQNPAELTTKSKAGAKTDITRQPDRSGWVRCTPAVLQNLLVQGFPWKVKPDLFASDKTILSFSDSSGPLRVYSFLWCYLRREVKGNNTSLYDPASKSTVRVEALPWALERLSKQFIFKSSRARSVHSKLGRLGTFLNWADDPRHNGAYEAVLMSMAPNFSPFRANEFSPPWFRWDLIPFRRRGAPSWGGLAPA